MLYWVKSSWPGRENLSKADLSQLWRHLEEQRLVRVVFYDGFIASFRDFADWAWRAGNHFAVIYRGDRPQAQPLAFFWLNGHSGQTAMMHFGFLAAGRPQALTIGRSALDWCFQGGLRALYGLTPALYVGVLEYIQKLGFRLLGVLPGACPMYRRGRLDYRSGVVSLITPADFRKYHTTETPARPVGPEIPRRPA